LYRKTFPQSSQGKIPERRRLGFTVPVELPISLEGRPESGIDLDKPEVPAKIATHEEPMYTSHPADKL